MMRGLYAAEIPMQAGTAQHLARVPTANLIRPLAGRTTPGRWADAACGWTSSGAAEAVSLIHECPQSRHAHSRPSHPMQTSLVSA